MTPPGDRVFVIAEAGVNHDGDVATALRMIDVASEAGADAVKFQTFVPELLATSWADKADYQKQNLPGTEGQLAMLSRLALDEGAHRALAERCRARGIAFLSTPFDLQSLALVAGLGVTTIKLGSGAVTHGPLLFEAARTGRPIILSTGMSDLDEVEGALRLLAFGYTTPDAAPTESCVRDAFASAAGRAALEDKVTLLHCTTAYPTPLDQVNLRAMATLRDAFGLRVGYSDHTTGIDVAVAAAALGAEVIEKHFTLDRDRTGPDHRASIEPDELRAMVDGIRRVQTPEHARTDASTGIDATLEAALGSPEKKPTAQELSMRTSARQSLVAHRAIKTGERFTRDNLGVKRPQAGISPMRYWDWLGRTATRDYAPDETIQP